MEKQVKAKFSLGQLSGLFLTLATVGIVAVISISINSDTAADFVAGSNEANASADITESMTNVTSKMPTYGLVAGFALVLGVVFVLARQAQG